jgi:hypothetical protein
MTFSVSDVETNVRAFVDSVKRATGNAKSLDSSDRKLKSSGGSRPGQQFFPVVIIPYTYRCFSDANKQSDLKL